MKEIYPVAKLGHQVLIINKGDVSYIGKEKASEVKCIKVDFKHRVIDHIIELEKHLKFNPWEELTDEERSFVLVELGSKFPNEEISMKIKDPLALSLIKSRN